MKKVWMVLIGLILSNSLVFGNTGYNQEETEEAPWEYKCEAIEIIALDIDDYSVVSANSDTTYLINEKNLSKGIWVLGLNKIDNSLPNEGYFKLKLEFKGDKFAIIQTTSYTCNGNILNHDKKKVTWDYIIPGTVVEKIHDAYLNKKNKKNSSKK
jgi:hypothetical protein